jgi:hypothetical protein
MRFDLIFLLLFLMGFSLAGQKKSVSIKITFLQPYCGGARPTKEMLAESQKPKPYAKKTIVIVSEEGKIDSARTNNSGILKLKLKAGQYKLFETWRYFNSTPAQLPVKDFDKDCLKPEWQKEIKTVVVTSKKAEVIHKNDIIIACPWNVPCILESAKPPIPE